MAWIFALVLILTTHTYPNLFGTLICFIGAALRFWASGYLRKDKYPAIGGPYRLTRNPLYLGTYLMAAGATLAVNQYALFVVLSVLYIAVYHYIILDEEIKLHQIFGEPYARFTNLVPRFFPRLIPLKSTFLSQVNPTTEHHRFSRELAKQNKAHEPFLTFIGLIAGLYLLVWLRQKIGF